MKELFRMAREATAQVIEAIHDAQAELGERAGWVSGNDVLSSNRDTDLAIGRAIARLTEAQKVLSATKWPRPRDYDLL